MSNKLKKYAIMYRSGHLSDLKVRELRARSKVDAVVEVVNLYQVYQVADVERIKE